MLSQTFNLVLYLLACDYWISSTAILVDALVITFTVFAFADVNQVLLLSECLISHHLNQPGVAGQDGKTLFFFFLSWTKHAFSANHHCTLPSRHQRTNDRNWQNAKISPCSPKLPCSSGTNRRMLGSGIAPLIAFLDISVLIKHVESYRRVHRRYCSMWKAFRSEIACAA